MIIFTFWLKVETVESLSVLVAEISSQVPMRGLAGVDGVELVLQALMLISSARVSSLWFIRDKGREFGRLCFTQDVIRSKTQP